VHVAGEGRDDDPLAGLTEDSVQDRRDVPLGRREPRDLRVRRVREQQVDTLVTEAKARRSVSRPSSGSWSILKSPVWSTRPAAVLMATASASGIEWFTATNSQSKGPIRSR